MPGVEVASLGTALVAALVLGLVSATIGAVVRLATFPIRLLTLGLFSLVINAALFWVATALVDGFAVDGAGAAFVGAIAYGLLTWLVLAVVGVER